MEAAVGILTLNCLLFISKIIVYVIWLIMVEPSEVIAPSDTTQMIETKTE